MKKTIITSAIALTLAASASAATLVAEWDGFDSSALTQNGYTLTLGNGTITNGILSVPDAAIANRSTIDLTGAGLTLSTGWTIMMAVESFEENGFLLGLGNSTQNFLLGAGTNASGYTNICYASSVDNAANTTGDLSDGGSSIPKGIVTITGSYDTSSNKSTFSIYHGATLIGSAVTKNAVAENLRNAEITTLALGGWAGNSDNDKAAGTISSLAIYSGAMTADEIAAAVPEPTTATLSLLALAGLAARRRRK